MDSRGGAKGGKRSGHCIFPNQPGWSIRIANAMRSKQGS